MHFRDRLERAGKPAAEQGRGGSEPGARDPRHARGMAIARRMFIDYAETFKALAR